MEKEKKRRGWFERIRRLFSSDPKPKPSSKPPEKKAKSKRWRLPGKLRTQTSFALPAPQQQQQQEEEVGADEAEDEQSRRAVAVAVATAAAAEAAVAAARAAAEVVRLTGHQHQQPAAVAPSRHERAAVAIQSAYRGYLARRALRALKGLVRLQALIRGQAVRRQTAATLRGLESLIKIQARHRAGRSPNPDDPDDDDDMMLLRKGGRPEDLYAGAVHEQDREREEQQQAGNGGWDSSIFSKEEMGAMMRSREEAALKRVRARQYASIQNEKLGIRRPPITRDEMEALNRRWSWLEEWVGSHHHHQPPPFDKDVPVAHQSPYYRPDNGCSARRSFARSSRRTPPPVRNPFCHHDDDDDHHQAAAAAFPGYMASTASAKAKFRSMSTPKERGAASSDDAYSDHCFPFADRMLSPIPSMSPIPSVASDMCFARSVRPPVAHRSPRVLKGPMTPARSRSRRSPSRHSFGSEAALHQLQIEHYTPVR